MSSYERKREKAKEEGKTRKGKRKDMDDGRETLREGKEKERSRGI